MSLPSSPHALLQRLEQLDKRLKEIEEKQRVYQKSYFSAVSQSSSHHQSPNAVTTESLEQQKFQSLGSSAKDINSREKGSLMDRLIILETRIVKLNDELKGSITSSSSKDLQVLQWVQPGESRKQMDDPALSSQQSPRAADEQGGESLERGIHQPSGQKCCKKLQVKESKESIHAGEKKSRCCYKNNRRARSRWFAIGC
ncbi:hypothetical protein ACLOJK_037724 [Asimina triloba]